ncbi:molybdenum cofactor sulfurase [Virgisporangium aliadipatigenens]|uniref:Molybdenum cofactor sulfurase n=1 Tax=Virgisporangium aliadipatigenens TaxID=741659 RepID=A0A8J3YGC3_9ACTN|nr:MOSC domain-containing protein [Virgisporangium aliadipatigenens]GIJ43461.1 molybdenum cofactor sulfurase [Virgisporangium aliadipatigenens]
MRVAELWRYPVKSVGGERLTEADVGPDGITGDRTTAVLDARNEVTWAGAIPGLMRVSAAALLAQPAETRARWLSDAVGEPVTLAPHAPPPIVHVLTTASLRTLGAALPDSALDPTRFRPNVVLDVDGPGCPEQSWIGRRLEIGAVRLRFTEACDRCVVITKETLTVPPDRGVLRWVAREFGNAFGVYAAVETPGRIRVGDGVRVA